MNIETPSIDHLLTPKARMIYESSVFSTAPEVLVCLDERCADAVFTPGRLAVAHAGHKTKHDVRRVEYMCGVVQATHAAQLTHRKGSAVRASPLSWEAEMVSKLMAKTFNYCVTRNLIGVGMLSRLTVLPLGLTNDLVHRAVLYIHVVALVSREELNHQLGAELFIKEDQPVTAGITDWGIINTLA